jgi:protease I
MRKKGIGFFVLVLLALVLAGGCGRDQRADKPASGGEITGIPGVQAPKPSPSDKPAARVLFVIAPSMFRDEEYQIPRGVLETHGCAITVASATPETATGAYGLTVKPDVTLGEARGQDYDAVVFVGGGGAKGYYKNTAAHRLAREALDAGRVVGAICIAPGILAEAGVLQGRKCTAYPSVKRLLQRKGAAYTGEGVVVDGNLVTAKEPQYARDFGNAVAGLLAAR